MKIGLTVAVPILKFNSQFESRFYLSLAINYGIDFDKIILNNILANNNKSNSVSEKAMSLNSFHFDAHALAAFLRKIAEQRGIKRIEGIVSSVDDENGYITGINIEDLKIATDFVFDCSGFRRLLIGKHYGTKWISYQDHLKVKAAIPFFLPQDDNNIFPYTRSIAMKNGWMWQIPLQHRIGAGYIFDSDFIDQDQAHREAEEFLGHAIDPIKLIKFDAGRFDQMWVMNCLAVGLSSGFTEPIEATSIMLTTVQLSLLNSFAGGIIHRSHEAIEKYNQVISDINNHTMDFLSFHYATKRDDSEFWKSLRDHNFLPDNLKEQIVLWEDQIPTSLDNHSYWDQFTADNYLLVGHGLGIFDNNRWSEYFSSFNAINNKQYWLEINQKLNRINDTATDHSSYLKRLIHG
jgi:tryptophan halogenase